MAEECGNCGGPNARGARLCAWCGASLPQPPPSYPPPLDFERAPTREVELDEPPAESDDEEGPSGLSIARIILSVVLLVVGLIGFGVASTSYQTVTTTSEGSSPSGGAGPVNVTQVSVSSPDDTCGLNGAGAGGFSTGSYGSHTVVWWLPLNGAPVPCSIRSVVSESTGFTFWGNFPLTVNSSGTPLMITINTPAAYAGVLTLIIQ